MLCPIKAPILAAVGSGCLTIITLGYFPTYNKHMMVLKFFPLHVLFLSFIHHIKFFCGKKNVITFDFLTNIHCKMTIFYLSMGKVLFVRLISLSPGSSICLTN